MRGTKKNKVFLIILYVAMTLVIASVCFAFIKIGKIEKTKELKTSAYTIGIIAEEDGTDAKNDYALRTKDYLSAAKFNNIAIKEDCGVTYQIFYYDENKAFIGKSGDLTSETTELPATQTVSETAKNVEYFRVVIKVTDNAKKLSIWNKADYVKKVTVTLNK